MAVNKLRCVEHTDDGCSLYQCLKCYKKLESRTDALYAFTFCPFCGTRWEGRFDSFKVSPRLQFEFEHGYNPNEPAWENSGPMWQIQRRFVGGQVMDGNWENLEYCAYPMRKTSARQVKSILDGERETRAQQEEDYDESSFELWGRVQFRAIVRKNRD